MNETELKQWLRDLLHMRGEAATEVNLRHDEAPHEVAARRWNATEGDAREEFRRVVIELIEEAWKTPWADEPFHQLAFLVEAANLRETVRAFETAATSLGRRNSEQTATLHMIALRTLVALGWKGSPEFWWAQMPSIGSRWPELLFRGLANHDLRLVFNRLPELITDKESMRRLLNLFPGLMRDCSLGLSELNGLSSRVAGNLPPEAAALMREWFQLRKCPLNSPATPVNSTLQTAIEKFFGPEKKPRFLKPSLCAANEELALAA